MTVQTAPSTWRDDSGSTIFRDMSLLPTVDEIFRLPLRDVRKRGLLDPPGYAVTVTLHATHASPLPVRLFGPIKQPDDAPDEVTIAVDDRLVRLIKRSEPWGSFSCRVICPTCSSTAYGLHRRPDALNWGCPSCSPATYAQRRGPSQLRRRLAVERLRLRLGAQPGANGAVPTQPPPNMGWPEFADCLVRIARIETRLAAKAPPATARSPPSTQAVVKVGAAHAALARLPQPVVEPIDVMVAAMLWPDLMPNVDFADAKRLATFRQASATPPSPAVPKPTCTPVPSWTPPTDTTAVLGLSPTRQQTTSGRTTTSWEAAQALAVTSSPTAPEGRPVTPTVPPAAYATGRYSARRPILSKAPSVAALCQHAIIAPTGTTRLHSHGVGTTAAERLADLRDPPALVGFAIPDEDLAELTSTPAAQIEPDGPGRRTASVLVPDPRPLKPAPRVSARGRRNQI